MKANIYNQKGEKTGEMELPKKIFEIKMNSDLVHQILVSQMSNRRQNIAHTKDRSEVSGGGKKPWAQKGTGRARHGSIRSPLWKGGGVTFGPRKEKNYKKEIPDKMRKKAMFMVLTEKAKGNFLIIIDEIGSKSGKTKEIFGIMKNFPCKSKSAIIALPEYDKKSFLASRNIPKTKTMEARELNAMDLLNYKYLLMPKKSIEVIEKTFIKS